MSKLTRVFRKHLLLLSFILILPLALTSFIWIEVWRGVASRAIDGSGHYAIAQIYDSSIFPDTFGWTHAYFGGMSFPNFYPPLFFTCVSLLHHSQIFSFGTAFKLTVVIPLLLLPLAFWLVMWVHSERNTSLAFSVAIASVILCTLGEVFQPSMGLDVSSTILDGFYTQPLGFILLLFWSLVYLMPRQRVWQFSVGSILLALTVLANFFNAITATLLIGATLIGDTIQWYQATNQEQSRAVRRTLLLHLFSPLVSLGLTAFWLVPMISSYDYLVTRPLTRPLNFLITPPLWCWYAIAGIGIALWWRRPVGRLGPYIATCIALIFGLLFSGSLAPTWFPLQSFRFLSTLNFLLSVPVAFTVSYVARWYVDKRDSRSSNESPYPNRSTRKQVLFISVTLVGFVLLAVIMSTKKLTRNVAFYTSDNFQRIGGVLEFGRNHRDGRYLVEVLPSSTNDVLVRADSLALNSYLGAQGNETISVVYREASPNSSFFNAQLNAFSAHKENFGISSVLMDDRDFINQPLTQHFKRLQFIGVRYLVIATPEMKERLSREPEIGARHDIGNWSVFELRAAALPAIRQLDYRPALVMSDFTVKLRRQNQLDFVRLAEEQFSDAWFDVLLTRAPETKIDKLQNLDLFGALILDTYDFEDELRAFDLLKQFARMRPLILLERDSSLLDRIKGSLADFPHAFIIQRQPEALGGWVQSMGPSHNYNDSSIRETWRAIRRILDSEKLRVQTAEIWSSKSQRTIEITINNVLPEKGLPILITSTFHPKWERRDNEQLYAVTPFFTLGFVNQSTQLVFERTWSDRLALWISLATFFLLVVVSFPYKHNRHFIVINLLPVI